MKSKKDLYGTLSFSYVTLAMPLEVAHKVQALLAEHAVKVDPTYCSNGNPIVHAIRPWDVDPVSVIKVPQYDCTEMSGKDYAEWAAAIREREEGAPIMDPKDFALLRGGE